MYVKENGLEKNRIGISVSKKVGNIISKCYNLTYIEKFEEEL